MQQPDINPYESPSTAPPESESGVRAGADGDGDAAAGLGDPIYLEGSFSFQDWCKLDRLLLKGHRWRNALSVVWTSFITLCLLDYFFQFHDIDDLPRSFYATIVVGVLLVSAFVFFCFRRKRTIRAYGYVQSSLNLIDEFRLSDEGFYVRTRYSEGSQSWSSFRKFRHTEVCCVLYTEYPSDWQVFFRSRFPDDESWERFRLFVQQRFQSV